MGSEWSGPGPKPSEAVTRKGEICIHHTVLQTDFGTGFVVVACRPPCPEYSKPVQDSSSGVSSPPEVITDAG